MTEKLSKSKPYQPLLLRIIHNSLGIFAVIAMITAFWTYNTYDGRFGKISWLPDWQEIEGIHGTFGLFALLILPFFVVYTIHRGNKKLIQKNSFNQLKLINKPIWWYSLHRVVNTIMIFSLTFATFTGKMMDEDWLPEGELNHFWYYLHLISLLILILTISFHLLFSIKIGSYPLLISIVEWHIREKDNWNLWLNNLKTFTENWRNIIKKEWVKLSPHLKILELTILLIIISSWILSVLK